MNSQCKWRCIIDNFEVHKKTISENRRIHEASAASQRGAGTKRDSGRKRLPDAYRDPGETSDRTSL